MSEKTITHEQLDAEASCWDASRSRSQYLRRAAFTIRALTAEVERLRGLVCENCGSGDYLALPTPAPEATDGR